MQLRTIDVGVPLRYADYGGDGPPIVLVHGLGGLHLNWMRIAPDLTRHGRVLAVDLPGFGGTPPLPGGVSMEGFEATMLRFFEAVTPGPFSLGGNSLGGALSILLAAELGERVKHLFLFSPAVPHAYFEPFDLRAFFTMGTAMLPFFGAESVRERAVRVGPERLVREMMAFMTHDRKRVPADVYAAHIAEAADRVDRPWVGTAFTEALRSLSWTLLHRDLFAEKVRAIKASGVVFAGQRDRLVRTRSVREMAALNPKFQFHSWDDVGHVAQLEVPERVMAILDAHFAAHDASAAA